MIEGYNIKSIVIREPYIRKGDTVALEGTIELDGYGNEIKMKIDPELLKPIVNVIAGAIAEAGRRAAQAMVQLAESHGATVIEHHPAAIEQAAEQTPGEVAKDGNA